MIGIISYKDLELWDVVFPPEVKRSGQPFNGYHYPKTEDSVSFQYLTVGRSYKEMSVKYEDRNGWYIILLGNLNCETKALKLVLDNYEYLNKRTRDVRFFMPGFIVDRNGIKTSSNEVSHKEKFHFYEDGFLETVDWLEDGNADYLYSEDLEIILLPYKKTPQGTSYDFEHMLSYNLDKLLAEEKNIIQFITKAVKVVHQSMTFEDTVSQMAGEADSLKPQPSCKIFIAGSITLEQERDGIRAAFSQLNNKGNILYKTWTFEDFGRTFVPGGRQQEYNSFIVNDADYAVFILNDNVGGITLDEFNLALDSYKKTGHPKIHVYCHVNAGGVADHEIQSIKDEINRYEQYYTEYYDVRDLKSQVKLDFSGIKL